LRHVREANPFITEEEAPSRPLRKSLPELDFLRSELEDIIPPAPKSNGPDLRVLSTRMSNIENAMLQTNQRLDGITRALYAMIAVQFVRNRSEWAKEEKEEDHSDTGSGLDLSTIYYSFRI
jgi:hypothetical protein